MPSSTYMRFAEHAFTLSYLRNGACSIRVCYIVPRLLVVHLVIRILLCNFMFSSPVNLKFKKMHCKRLMPFHVENRSFNLKFGSVGCSVLNMGKLTHVN